MATAFIITLRETLEAALIIGILLAALDKTKNKKYKKQIWLGIAGGILLSLILAAMFNHFSSTLSGEAEEIFELSMILLACGLLTWMIFWMISQRRTIKGKLENRIQIHAAKNSGLGIFLLSLVSVGREGFETAIFLEAAAFKNSGNLLLGGILGVLTALIFGNLLFRGLSRFSLKVFFGITTFLLILFAGALFSEIFSELHIIPESLAYLVYVSTALLIWWRMEKKSIKG